MKDLYEKKKEILLWCYDYAIKKAVGKKRQNTTSPDDPGAPATKAESFQI